MEKRIGCLVVLFAALVMLENDVKAQIYTCWGGCYNECFLRSNKTSAERLSCFYGCVINCLPHSAADYQNYCQIGCSLELCLQNGNDGVEVERCFGRCTNICKFSRTNI